MGGKTVLETVGKGIEDIRRSLFVPGTKWTSPHVRFWLLVSVLFGLGFSVMGLLEAFQVPYTIQDDARQHVFWMQRFIDPELFPSDPIADYYQSVAPAGVRTLYRFLAWLGVSPILASKLIPPVLFVLDAVLAYWLCLAIIPIPAAAFSAALLLSQALAMNDAVFSGTAKGFTYVCGLSVLLCLTRGWLWPFLLAIALQSLFYPQLVLIFAVMLLLGLVERSSDGIQSSWLVLRSLGLRWCQSRKLRVMCLSGFAVAVVVMLPFLLSENEFGPTVTFEQARAMPEFFSGGRVPFFYDDDPLRFWLHGRGGAAHQQYLDPRHQRAGLEFAAAVVFPSPVSPPEGVNPRRSLDSPTGDRLFGLVCCGPSFAVYALFAQSIHRAHVARGDDSLRGYCNSGGGGCGDAGGSEWVGEIGARASESGPLIADRWCFHGPVVALSRVDFRVPLPQL